MATQQAGGWSRREFLRRLTLAAAAGMFGVSPRPVTAVEEQQMRVQTDKPSALGVCPQRDANADEICPHCCNYGYKGR
jgi:hypothetical protein